MKWERGMALVVLGLILLLLIRGILSDPLGLKIKGDGEVQPVLVDLDQPFYPVYFATPDAQQLVPEFRQGQATIDQVLADLVEGPRRKDLVRVLPPETKVLGYSKRGNVLYVNFSHHLITNHPGGSAGEIITVYGIVNTLVGLSGVRRVQILVDSEQIETLAGHLNLKDPLQKDYTILASSLL